MNDAISRQHFDERVRLAGGMADEELTQEFKNGVLTVLELLKTEPSVQPNSCEDALEKLSYLTDRPCEVCKAHGRDGCGLWTCVFTSVQPTQEVGRWIPCSERLPEDRRTVLVTAYWHETYQVMMASYFGDGLWWCVPFNNCGKHMQRLNPKAWMPLPEPWKEGE